METNGQIDEKIKNMEEFNVKFVKYTNVLKVEICVLCVYVFVCMCVRELERERLKERNINRKKK